MEIGSDGEYLELDDVRIWHKVKGHEGCIPTIYLHGGPGYNSYAFEKSVGALLERGLRMVYLDQRGGGRSRSEHSENLGITLLRNDVESLRIKLGAEKINLIAHSFGGLVAAEYMRKFERHVNKVIFVDISADLKSAFQNQISHYAEIAKIIDSPNALELKRLADSDAPAPERLMKVFDFLPVQQAHRHLLYASDGGQTRNNGLDEASKLGGSDALWKKLARENYLDSSHPELMKPLNVPALLFSGKFSNCIGKTNIERAAELWRIPLVWFDKSGHFPYIEESELFAERVVDFLGQP